jgi:DNA-binding CsgD family transcriptional regulator
MTLSAHKFLAALDGVTNAAGASTSLPLAVQRICTELEHDTKQDSPGTDGNTMQVRHLARTAHGAILVRGYGIVEQHGGLTGRFFILLEMAPTESSAHETQGETDYQFTPRQQAIVSELVLARTNKEIAESLRISVHTVKDYIRQLMMKLHTTSRSGIVARVSGFTLSSPKASGRRTAQAAQATVQVA